MSISTLTSVNDTHSLLNATQVLAIHEVQQISQIQALLKESKSAQNKLAICGARHAMGGQQFANGGILLDMSKMNRILSLDSQSGVVTVEAGINWQELIHGLQKLQSADLAQDEKRWVIAQKPTGADDLTLGGSLSANIHGRGLQMKPLISDIEEFSIVDAYGNLIKINRREEPELFRLVIGGYGLFGVITEIKLRLKPFSYLKRCVSVEKSSNLAARFCDRSQQGHLYGDFQFAIDPDKDNFLTEGIFSSYMPVEAEAPSPNAKKLSMDDWKELLNLAHFDKSKAYEKYKAHYLASDGQIYPSDTHQLSTYLPGYHAEIDRKTLPEGKRSSEVIGEHYVPLEKLDQFLHSAAAILQEMQAEIVYGTVRIIKKDDESFLPWAKEDYACTIFNVHTVHDDEGKEKTSQTFRRLIQLSLSLGGSFYLTYHRYALRTQIELCYPQFQQFLQKKLEFDPQETFSTDWWIHYKKLFS